MPSDISVRFSPVGVQQVLGAFQQVKAQAQTTGSEGGKGLNAISAAMSGIAGAVTPATVALAAVATAVLVVKAAATELYDMALAARQVEEDIGKMAERVGGSVETLSALHVATVDNEVGMDALEKGMVKLAKAAAEAGSGSLEQKKSFQSLGITMQDLQRNDPSQLFVMVAKKIAALPAGTDKAALSLKLFGKAGAELIPLMNDVGSHWDDIQEKTKKLGLSLSSDMVAGAMAAQGAVHQLELMWQGAATSFDAGFMPRFAAGVETFAQSVTGTGVPAMKTFGTAAGDLFMSIASALTKAFVYVSAFWDKLMWDAKAVKAIARDVTSLDGPALAEDLGNYSEDRDTYRRRVDQKRDRKIGAVSGTLKANLTLAQTPGATGATSGTSGAGTNKEADAKALEEANRAKDALVKLQQSLADNQLAILRASHAAAEQEDKRRYDAGELSLKDYYQRRADRINAAYLAESAALQAKVKAADALPASGKDAAQTAELQAKKSEAQAKAATDLQLATLKFHADLTANTAEQAAAEKAMSEKNLQNEQKLATMVGDRHRASLLALQQELDTYKDLLKQQGKSDGAIAQALEEAKTRGTAKITFGELQDQATAAFGDLDRAVGRVNTDASAGAISQITATGKIISIERDRLPALGEIITQMEAQAAISKDPAQIQAVQELRDKWLNVSTALNTVQTAGTYLANQMKDFLNNDVGNVFGDWISGAKSFGSAMEDLANTFEQMVGRMIAKMLVYYAFAAILGWLMPGSDLLGDLFPGGPFGGGKATGGNVKKGTKYLVGEKGPEILEMGGDGFVTPHKQSMAALAAASSMPQLRTLDSISSSSDTSGSADVSDGGFASAQGAAAAPAPVINIQHPANTQAQTSQRTGSQGQSITDIIISTINTDIAKGGTTAKTLQGQFGLTRQGTTR